MSKLRDIVVRSRSLGASLRDAEVCSNARTMGEGDSFTFDADPRDDMHLAQTLMRAEGILNRRGMTLVTEQGGPRQGKKWWALPKGHPDAVRVPLERKRDYVGGPPDWSKLVPAHKFRLQ